MGYAVTQLDDGRTSWRAIASIDGVGPGEVYADAPPDASVADYAGNVVIAVQAWLDSEAARNGYDSIASCVSYADSTVTRYREDAIAAIAWRDAVWSACYAMNAEQASNPPDPLPSSAQIIAQLPQPESFGWVVHAHGKTSLTVAQGAA